MESGAGEVSATGRQLAGRSYHVFPSNRPAPSRYDRWLQRACDSRDDSPGYTSARHPPAHRDRRQRGNAVLRLPRPDDSCRVSVARRRARRLSPRGALRAESQFVARNRAAAHRARGQRRRQFDGRGRHRAAVRRPPEPDHVHRRRQERRRTVAGHRARAQGDQRGIAGRTGSARSARSGPADDRARRAPRQPGYRRAQPPAYLDRPQEQQVRRAASSARRRSSARFSGGPACRPSACTATSARRSPPSSRF